MRPLTLTMPKPLLPILNKPFIYYQLEALNRAHVSEIVLACGSQTPIFKRNLNPFWGKKFKLLFAREEKLLGTGGAIRIAFDSFPKGNSTNEPVIVLNGDVLFEINFLSFLKFHQLKGSRCSIALTLVPNASRFGLVKCSPAGRIKEFVEKPKGSRGKQWINAGAYIIDSDLIETIPTRRPVSVEREIFPRFLNRGFPVFAFKTNGYWNDIGTPQTYLLAHQNLMGRKKYWTENSLLRKRGALIGKNCRISPEATVAGPVCLGNNVLVGSGAKLTNSVIFSGTRIQKGSEITGAIIGKNCEIGEFSQISKGTVLGDNSKIPSFTRC